MPDLIPFIPGENNYRLGVPLDTERAYFRTRWNDRDNAWYVDLYDETKQPILLGIKLVLGVHLGSRSTHDFFTKHMLMVLDTTASGIEAGFNDLGERVIVTHHTADEIHNGNPTPANTSTGTP